MRHSLIALTLLLLPASLVAQRRGGTLVEDPRPAPVAAPRTYTHRGYYPRRDIYPRPLYVEPPRISMDSAVQATESRFYGWMVDSKALGLEYWRPVYRFGMISGGEIGSRILYVDGDTGEALNPEILGAGQDTTSYRSPWRPYPSTPTYP